MIIYRRDQEHMSAHSFEAEEALEEGVRINWLRTIKQIESESITIEEVELDEDGRVVPTGRFETLEADSLILALGQEVDTSLLNRVPELDFDDSGVVRVDRNMMTSVAGLFAGGDMVPAERSITNATGHGKKAARCIDAWLRGENLHKPERHPVIDFKGLHLWFNTDAQASSEPVIAAAERDSFDEIVGSITDDMALYEAGRCYSCGNCFECDGCYGACPEDAIIKLGKGKRYRVNYDQCTGCEACYNQCPCHAIEMVPQQAETVEHQPLNDGIDQESAR